MDTSKTHTGLKLTGTDAERTDDVVRSERITLRRGEHRWTFSFWPDEIPALKRRIQMMILDPRVPLDTYDAAIVLHRLDGVAIKHAHGRSAAA